MLVGAELRGHRRARLVEQRQIKPVDAIHQHAEPGAQIPRHHIEQPDLTAVRIKQHQFVDAGGRHRFGNFRPQANEGVGFERQRAGKARVFGAETDRLRRQKQRGQIIRQVRQRGGNDALGQRRIDVERQVRAVLFSRGHRQHGDAARQIELGKVGTFKIGPETGQGRTGRFFDRHPGIFKRDFYGNSRHRP